MNTLKALMMMLVLGLILGVAAQAEAKKKPCIDCHTKVTPGIVEQFLDGVMGKKKFDCSICHGSSHKSESDVAKVSMPTPDTCNACHADKVAQYKEGKHSIAWVAGSSMPMWGHQPSGITGDGYKGCSSCHKIGIKSPDVAKEYHYGSGACDSCHTRHTFSKAEAQDPRACQTCHMGFDHPQWEMWSTSKHGTIWEIEGTESNRAPTCQTCHMPDGGHDVITSWG
ncbi:MAG: hypothetical protein KAR83_01710, partial [Thermodesulfovibrionales bacterium]|nr:hypothetical protein [Thermodesulfovibrionales bacterium]